MDFKLKNVIIFDLPYPDITDQGIEDFFVKVSFNTGESIAGKA